MKIELVPIDRVIPYARNPRKGGAVAKVAGSLKEFGWKQPIVVDSDMVVIAGHTRLEAARQLGMDKVPVLVARDLDPVKAKAYRIADNRVAQDAEWDAELLGLELTDLKELAYDLPLLGFEDDELAAYFNGAGTGAREGEDDVPGVPEAPVTARGDVWLLGDHRLVCGDAENPADVERALAGVRPLLMVTDPPYGVRYDPSWREGVELGVGERSKGKVRNDDRADWRAAWDLFPGHVAYVWHAGNFAGEVQTSLEAAGFVMRAQIIWVKQHFVISRGDYHWQHEPCWYAVHKRGKGHWAGGRKQTTIWQIANNNSFGNSKGREETWGHGTQKPVECMRRPILNNSSPGQAVYDPFVGSGTTIIAAETTGRSCLAMEIDPIYCDVAVRRWEKFTGKAAVLEGGGTFEEIAAARMQAAA